VEISGTELYQPVGSRWEHFKTEFMSILWNARNTRNM